MKRVKRSLAIFMTLALILSMTIAMGAVSYAADGDGYTITVSETDTHTYKVFQVLTGTLSKDGKTLSNAAWGADAVNNHGELDDFVASITAEGLSEAQIASLVSAKANTSGAGRGTVDKDNQMTGLAPGYYVLVDSTDLPENETKALNVVHLVNDITVEIKHDSIPDVKEITTDTLGKDSDNHPVNGKVNNVSIGDTINYKITSRVPANASKYNYFYFVMNDTLSEGLTFTVGSIKVYKDSVSEANLLTEGADYQVKTGEDAAPKTFMVALNDAKSLAGENIIVTYSAVLNKNAEIGETPNINTHTVTFSNDPNHDYDGENYPGFPDEDSEEPFGETPDVQTKTYTTGIEIEKVDQDGNVLTGAEFTITGDSLQIVLVSEETFTEAADGNYYKLKNGSYTTEVPVTADRMDTAPAGATAGYVEDADYTGDDIVVVGDKTYRPYAPDTDGGKTIYILIRANADKYDSTTTKYKKTVTYSQNDTTQDLKVTAEVGADGIVTFKGLGAGEYTITETKTPDGYNTIDPIKVNIAFNASPAAGGDHWSKTGDSTAVYNSATGVFEITIENESGATLPSTGGIGTVIFYVLGSILVIGSGIVLISRKRMENK